MVINDLFAQVLDNKDLSKAGDLFSLDDDQIVDDLSEVLQKIRLIAEETSYIENDNDQSVVEICITRVTTAIRETDSIDRHTLALIELLESCLTFDLEPSHKQDDPPHAKIASDVMTCLFVHYSHRSVMELTMPVIVKFLTCPNKELSRNVSSYLSLAAIDNSDLLAQYSSVILDSILQGNTYLTRVLPQLYTTIQPLLEEHAHKLVGVLDQCEIAERSSLLELFTFFSKIHPQLMEEHVQTLCDHLTPNLLTPLTLAVLVDIVDHNPSAIEPHLSRIKMAAEAQPSCIGHLAHILAAVGVTSEAAASDAVSYLLTQLSTSTIDTSLQSCILQEIGSVARVHPSLYTTVIPALDKLSLNTSTSTRLAIQQICDDHNTRCSSAAASPGSPKASLGSAGSGAGSATGNGCASGAGNGACKDPMDASGRGGEEVSGDGDATMVASPTHTPASFMVQTPVPESSPDTVQQFCDKHLTKIKTYISQLSSTLPLPTKCCVVNGKHKRFVRLSFQCSLQSDQCIYSHTYFTLRTKIPYSWLHLMFLSIQSKSCVGLGQTNAAVKSLKTCLDALKSDHSSLNFITLTTSAFPSDRDKEALLQELHSVRFFDVFELHNTEKQWTCFVCNHPEKVTNLLQDGTPTISGQLKEKKGRWKFLKRWKTRYFTLSGSQITSSKNETMKGTLPISKIQSVKAVRKASRDIPKAFEIFTADQTYIFKAKDHQNAEQWLQCIQIALARSQGADGSAYTGGAHESITSMSPSLSNTLIQPRLHAHIQSLKDCPGLCAA